MKPIISFCIVTYMREKKVCELVKEILKYQKQRIEVVVVDDHSADNTYAALEQIQDNRLKVYTNQENLGAKRNWYEALNKGQGEFLFQVLDRDWIKASKIDEIITMIKSNQANFGYCGNAIISRYRIKGDRRQEIYTKGIEALMKFACVPTHPTGHFFARKAWHSVKNREKYFSEDKWGIYPHGYISAIMALRYHGIIIHSDICNPPPHHYKNEKSRFYKHKKNPNYWWLPKTKLPELIAATNVIHYLPIADSWKIQILSERYYDELYAATVRYRELSENAENAARYNAKTKKIGKTELSVILLSFYRQYMGYVREKQYQWLDNEFIDNIKENSRLIYAEF